MCERRDCSETRSFSFGVVRLSVTASVELAKCTVSEEFDGFCVLDSSADVTKELKPTSVVINVDNANPRKPAKAMNKTVLR